MKWLPIAALTVVAGWLGTAQAAPLKLEDVPADAKWLAHVDVDAARKSSVVEKFFEHCGKHCPVVKKFMCVCGELGLKDCKGLHGITVYDTGFAPHHGVLIARAEWNAHLLEEKVGKAANHKTMKFDEYTIHTWTACKEGMHTHELAGALYHPDVLVVACCPELLKSALKVLEGKAKSAAGTSAPLAGKVSVGAIFLARATDLKEVKCPHCHPVLQQLKSFDYQKGEHEGRWFSKITVTADSPEVAERLGKVFEGFGAWLSLQAYKTPWAVELLSKAKLRVEGNVVKVRFREPVDTLVSHIPELCTLLREHLGMHGEMPHKHCKAMREHCKGEHEHCKGEHKESCKEK